MTQEKMSSEVIEIERQEEQEDEYDAQSPLLCKYDEFAAAVVATKNKKRSERKLRRFG